MILQSIIYLSSEQAECRIVADLLASSISILVILPYIAMTYAVSDPEVHVICAVTSVPVWQPQPAL